MYKLHRKIFSVSTETSNFQILLADLDGTVQVNVMSKPIVLFDYVLWTCKKNSCNFHTWRTVQRAQDVVDKVVKKIPSIQVLLA